MNPHLPDYRLGVITTTLSEQPWPIWIANGNYERDEDNLYTSYEGLSSQQRIPAPQEYYKWIHSPNSSACESSFWLIQRHLVGGKTWARDDHVIPIRYPDWPCSQHGCSDSVVVITPNR